MLCVRIWTRGKRRHDQYRMIRTFGIMWGPQRIVYRSVRIRISTDKLDFGELVACVSLVPRPSRYLAEGVGLPWCLRG